MKRSGAFFESARVYVDRARQGGEIYPGVLLGLYKTVASAGQLPLEYTILINVRGADVSDHAERLNDAMRSSAALENYLRDLSGNVGSYLPRDYSTMFAEVVSYKDRPASLIAQYDALSKPKNNGCYVATAVYGSYDCREVWVLRRFRDDNLAVGKAGRLFIACTTKRVRP